MHFLRDGDAIVARCAAPPRKVLPRECKQSVFLFSERHHPWTFTQEGITRSVAPGDVAIVDARFPREFEFPAGSEQCLLELPMAWAARWLAAGERSSTCVISRDRGWGRVLSVTCSELAQDVLLARQLATGQLSDQLGELACSMLAPRTATSRNAVVLASAREYIEARLADPLLSLNEAALALNLSARSLSRILSAHGTTFSGLVRLTRLERARALLADPQFRYSGLEDLAARCGFVTASHLVREFRRQWGLPPARWRRLRAQDSYRRARAREAADLDHLIAATEARVSAQESVVARLHAPDEGGSGNETHALEGMRQSLEALKKRRAAL